MHTKMNRDLRIGYSQRKETYKGYGYLKKFMDNGIKIKVNFSTKKILKSMHIRGPRKVYGNALWKNMHRFQVLAPK